MPLARLLLWPARPFIGHDLALRAVFIGLMTVLSRRRWYRRHRPEASSLPILITPPVARRAPSGVRECEFQSIAKDRYACPAPSAPRACALTSGPEVPLTYLRAKKIHPREVPLPAKPYTSSERPPNCTGGAGRVSSRFGKAGPGVSPGECMAPVIAPTLAPHFCAQPAQSLCLDHFHRLRRLPRWPFLESTAQ